MIWRAQSQPFRNKTVLPFALLEGRRTAGPRHTASPQPPLREHAAAEIKKLLEQPSLPAQIRMTNNSLSRPLFFGSAILKGLQLVKSD